MAVADVLSKVYENYEKEKGKNFSEWYAAELSQWKSLIAVGWQKQFQIMVEYSGCR